MTRFLRLDRPSCAPHFDIVNRDTNCGPVFDLGVDLVGYDGSLFIKVSDVQEMARSVGMLSAEDAKLITDENKRLQKMLDKLPEQSEVLKSELDRVVSDFHSRLSDDSTVSDAKVEPKADAKNSGKPESNGQSDLLDLLK